MEGPDRSDLATRRERIVYNAQIRYQSLLLGMIGIALIFGAMVRAMFLYYDYGNSPWWFWTEVLTLAFVGGTVIFKGFTFLSKMVDPDAPPAPKRSQAPASREVQRTRERVV